MGKVGGERRGNGGEEGVKEEGKGDRKCKREYRGRGRGKVAAGRTRGKRGRGGDMQLSSLC